MTDKAFRSLCFTAAGNPDAKITEVILILTFLNTLYGSERSVQWIVLTTPNFFYMHKLFHSLESQC